MYETVSFLSDYGRADEFVGVVKSVLRSMAPAAHVVDITHDVPAHDVRAGALCLARASQYLCPGVVLAVVDPGVGTARKAIAVEVGDGQSVLVGPDNGLLAPAVSMVGGAGRAVNLTDDRWHLPAPGPTFAGRDVFAPVVAHLCNGVDLAELGDLIDPALLLPAIIPVTNLDDDELACEVLWVDRYGNAQLNVDPDELDGWGARLRVTWAADGGLRTGRTAVRADAYGDLERTDLGLVVDSYGLLSVVLPRASAAATLGLRAGDEVRLVRLDGDAQEVGISTPVELRARG
ncbi:MAG: SAM-dependent chlorinase/fluorinase [Actinomycetota bacterium]|nr:SAM-dependent chlorinase/fluorinase [Acidimicrobiia bacterium]MDQ3293577.1 SAM-dependent chlorinase/fluorinase [Actinomycetota bacterium]